MNLSPEALALTKQLRIEAEQESTAPDGSYHPREVARRYVSKLIDLERFGHDWVTDYLEDLTITGAYEKCRDDRRICEPGMSRRGHALPVTVGAFDAKGLPVRRPFERLNLADLRKYRATIADRRNTAMARLRQIDRLIARMERDRSLSTVGEALRVKERAA